jgi:hypothetical protein
MRTSGQLLHRRWSEERPWPILANLEILQSALVRVAVVTLLVSIGCAFSRRLFSSRAVSIS